MSRAISKTEYGNKIIEGIKSAWNIHNNYAPNKSDFKSGEFHSAPEYLLTVEIAKSIGETGAPVLLEQSTVKTLFYGTSKTAGKYPDALTGKKRFDIVIYEKTGSQLPRAIIEVKHPMWNWAGKIENDMIRIMKALKPASAKKENGGQASLAHAYIAIYSLVSDYKDNENSTEERHKDRMKRIKNLADKNGLTAKIYSEELHHSGGQAGYAVSIHLSIKK